MTALIESFLAKGPGSVGAESMTGEVSFRRFWVRKRGLFEPYKQPQYRFEKRAVLWAETHPSPGFGRFSDSQNIAWLAHAPALSQEFIWLHPREEEDFLAGKEARRCHVSVGRPTPGRGVGGLFHP